MHLGECIIANALTGTELIPISQRKIFLVAKLRIESGLVHARGLFEVLESCVCEPARPEDGHRLFGQRLRLKFFGRPMTDCPIKNYIVQYLCILAASPAIV